MTLLAASPSRKTSFTLSTRPDHPRSTVPALPVVCSRLASAYALRGETERTAADLAEARRLRGDVFSSIAHVKAGGLWGVPKIRALFEAAYFAGLRKAGLPEE